MSEQTLKKNAAQSIHSGHRARLRERYLKSGFDSFSSHEILELLLQFSIPRRDTNPLAHELINHFGGIRGICNASHEELQEVAGIGTGSAILIDLAMELARRYAAEKLDPAMSYDTVSKIAEYFVNRYMGAENECLYMMVLNNRLNLIDCVLISEGSVNSSTVPVRKLTETAYLKRASVVVLAHNHPNGLAIPSPADVEMTETLDESFRLIGVQLLEHIVVADDRFYPIMQNRFGHLRRSPYTGAVESSFFDGFYDVDPKTWIAPSIFDEQK